MSRWFREPARGAALSVLCAALLYSASDFATRGMDLDGIAYANVGKLLADGHGGFWRLPYYETTGEDQPGLFVDHPPGVLFLTGLAFRWLGDAFWVEKALSLGWMLAVAVALAALARATGVNAAWALFIFLALPSTIDVLSNHYLEGPLALAMIAAVAAAYRAASALNLKRAATAAAVAGLMVAAGFWIKGAVALFPLVACPVFVLCREPLAESKTWLRAGATGAVGAGVVVAMIAIPLATSSDAFDWARAYLSGNVVASIDGSRPAMHGRMWQFGQIALHVGIAAALGCAAWLAVRGGRNGVLSKLKAALPWLVIACAGLLPLMVSARQFEHYLLPALPFLALAVARAAPLPVLRWPLRPLAAALLCLAIAVAVVRFGDVSRHRQYMDDAATVAQAIAPGRSVGICADLDRDRLSAYLFRNHDVLTRLGSGATRATHAICNAALEGRAPLLRLRDGSTLWRAAAPSGLEP